MKEQLDTEAKKRIIRSQDKLNVSVSSAKPQEKENRVCFGMQILINVF